PERCPDSDGDPGGREWRHVWKQPIVGDKIYPARRAKLGLFLSGDAVNVQLPPGCRCPFPSTPAVSQAVARVLAAAPRMSCYSRFVPPPTIALATRLSSLA